MKLYTIEQGRFKVVSEAVLDEDGEWTSTVLEYLMTLAADLEGSADGMLDLFEIYAKSGRAGTEGLTSSQMHHADTKEKILEFIKGKIRIFCYEDDGAILILSHGALKKGQKAARKDVKTAIRHRDRYLAAKSAGKIEFVEVENDDH